jgi:hypothetical protein
MNAFMKANFLATVALAGLTIAPRAIACECSSPADRGAIEEEIRSADLAATVRVTGFKAEERCDQSQSGERVCRSVEMVLVSIVHSMKGENSGVALLDVLIGTSCDPGLEVGEQVFLLAHRDAAVDQSSAARYVSSVCSMDKRNNGAIPPEFSIYRKPAEE